MANYYLYTTAKRHNSTLVPSGGIQAALVLKQGTSLLRPTFLLHFDSRPTASMIWFEDRYYFVNDIRAVRDELWELECEVDPLSTYKTEIMATSAFVLYDTTANTEIIDTRLSANTTCQRDLNYITLSLLAGNRCVIVGIVGKDSAGMWALTEDKASKLTNSVKSAAHNLFTPIDWNNDTLIEIMGKYADNISIGLEQYFASAKAPECIRSAILVPVESSAFNGTYGTIYLGDFDSDITGELLKASAHAYEIFEVAIPWRFSDWRRNRPFTDIYLRLPYVGTVPLSASQLIGATTIKGSCMVSPNGAITYDVLTGDGTPLGRYGGNCGSNYMMGSSNINPLNAIAGGSQVITAGAGVFGASSLQGAAAVGTAAIHGGVEAVVPTITSVGGCGGGAFTDNPSLAVICVTHDTNVQPSSVSAVMGTPTMATKSLSGLTGYVETRNFSVSGSMTDTERDMINRLMDGGVYIE